MIRTDILTAANAHITQDRQATHGNPENSFGLIATYWAAHLDCEVTAADVAVMMTLMKLARINGNPAHRDSYEDGCGYLAIAGELAGVK
jgi:hypothetical protein